MKHELTKLAVNTSVCAWWRRPCRQRFCKFMFHKLSLNFYFVILRDIFMQIM